MIKPTWLLLISAVLPFASAGASDCASLSKEEMKKAAELVGQSEAESRELVFIFPEEAKVISVAVPEDASSFVIPAEILAKTKGTKKVIAWNRYGSGMELIPVKKSEMGTRFDPERDCRHPKSAHSNSEAPARQSIGEKCNLLDFSKLSEATILFDHAAKYCRDIESCSQETTPTKRCKELKEYAVSTLQKVFPAKPVGQNRVPGFSKTQITDKRGYKIGDSVNESNTDNTKKKPTESSSGN